MKNHFPEGYCPQREKIVDLSRVVMSGGRRYARHRRNAGRYINKTNRQRSREVLHRATRWVCECNGDPEMDCLACFADDLPTTSQTHGSCDRPIWRMAYSKFTVQADDLGPLLNWYEARTKDMTFEEVQNFLRQRFLASPWGHSLQTRHAYDHLLQGMHWEYDLPGRWF